MNEFLVTCQHQATAFDLPFYDVFAPTKNSCFEVSDDVIACDLRFGPPPIKNPGYVYGRKDDAQTGDFRSKVQPSFSPIPASKSAETFTKVWKESWWQLKIFKQKSYGETALKPARGYGGEGAL